MTSCWESAYKGRVDPLKNALCYKVFQCKLPVYSIKYQKRMPFLMVEIRQKTLYKKTNWCF